MEQNGSYEQKTARLEEIVRKLESGEGNLDEMMTLYREGMTLYKECSGILDGYEREMTVLKAEDVEK